MRSSLILYCYKRLLHLLLRSCAIAVTSGLCCHCSCTSTVAADGQSRILENSHQPTPGVASSIKQPYVGHSVHQHQAGSPCTYYESGYRAAPLPGSAINDTAFLARAVGFTGHISQHMLSVQQPPVGGLAAQQSNSTDSLYYNVPNLSPLNNGVPPNTLHGVTGPPGSMLEAGYYDRTPPTIQQPSIAHSLGTRASDSCSEALSGPYSLFRSSPVTPAPRPRPFQTPTTTYASQLFGSLADTPDSLQHNTSLHQSAHITPRGIHLESPGTMGSLGLAQGQPSLASRSKACTVLFPQRNGLPEGLRGITRTVSSPTEAAVDPHGYLSCTGLGNESSMGQRLPYRGSQAS